VTGYEPAQHLKVIIADFSTPSNGIVARMGAQLCSADRNASPEEVRSEALRESCSRSAIELTRAAAHPGLGRGPPAAFSPGQWLRFADSVRAGRFGLA